jgi:hypothetical protein
VIDSGASITITPYKTDFISHNHPTETPKIKGIASGLEIFGMCDISYTFINDTGETQTLILPQCPIWLFCLRQIGTEMLIPGDGFNAFHPNPILTVHGKETTLFYDNTSQVLILAVKLLKLNQQNTRHLQFPPKEQIKDINLFSRGLRRILN